MKLVYPCVLIPDGSPGYSAIFPYIEEATSGETLYEALEMAEDLIKLEVKYALKEKRPCPEPPLPEKVEVPEGGILTLIRVDTDAYKNA